MSDPIRPVFVLAVTDLEGFTQLQDCMRGEGIQSMNVSAANALGYLRTRQVTVVIYDYDLGINHWRTFLAQIPKINNRPPKVIVASRHADNRFWGDVINQGGDDVLGKPFIGAEVLHAIRSMDQHWRHPGRHPSPK